MNTDDTSAIMEAHETDNNNKTGRMWTYGPKYYLDVIKKDVNLWA